MRWFRKRADEPGEAFLARIWLFYLAAAVIVEVFLLALGTQVPVLIVGAALALYAGLEAMRWRRHGQDG